jgi:hypothetical protein
VADAPEGYTVTGTPAGGGLRIKLTRGGPFKASDAKTLHFVVKKSGQIEGPPAPAGAPGTNPPTGAGGAGGSAGPCNPDPCGGGQNETATKPSVPGANEPAPPESAQGTCP